MPLIQQKIYRFENCTVDVRRRALTCAGVAVQLSGKTFDLLLYLVEHPDRVASKDELLSALWPDSFVEESNLSQQVFLLRKALAGCALGDRVVVTVPGHGYRFGAEIEVLPALAASGDVVVHAVQTSTTVLVHEGPVVDTRPIKERLLPATPQGRKMLWIVTGTLGLVAVCSATYLWMNRPRPVLNKVVLAQFQNQTGELVLGSALESALRISLEQSPYIDLLSRTQIIHTLATMQKPASTPLSGDVAREVCVRSNYQVVVSGTITRVASQYMISLEATNCETNATVAAETGHIYDENNVLDALDKLTRALRRELGESRRQVAEFQVPIKNATTSSLEALEDYSQGSLLLGQGNSQAAIDLFQKAVAIDPNFATAWRALGVTYGNRNENDKEAEYYKKAFDLRDRTTALERANIEISYWYGVVGDLNEAIASSKAAVAIYPENETLYGNLCNIYTLMGEYNEALEACERGRQLSPRGSTADRLSRVYRRLGRIDDAERMALTGLKESPNSIGLRETLFEIAFMKQDQQAIKLYGEWGLGHQQEIQAEYFMGRAAAAAGRMKEAASDFERGVEAATRSNDPIVIGGMQIQEAGEYADLGELANAARILKGVTKGAQPDMLAAAWVDAGDTAPARAYLASPAAKPNRNTIHDEVIVPTLRAAVAIADKKPEEAISDLESMRPYQLRDLSLVPLRADAEANAGRLEAAEADYRLVLANQGVDPLEAAYYLSHMLLARVLAKEGKTDQAKAEYRAFLDWMKNADAGLPVVVDARKELAALR